MDIRTLKDIPEIKGKRIIVRVDYNVPLQKDGEIQDDTRIVESLDTIKYLLEKGGRLIIVSHLGRPDGQYKEEFRLTRVAQYLGKLLNQNVKKFDLVLNDQIKSEIDGMQDSEIVMLENVRFHPGEESCDPKFTKELAGIGDIFVSDAFGAAHRKHASTAGIAQYLPAYAGLLMEKEIKALSPLMEDEPKRPLTMIFGGAKIDTKIDVIKNFLEKADYFLIGGGLANTFLSAKGYNVGKSLYEAEKSELANEIMEKAENFILPHDVVVAEEISETAKAENISIEKVENEMKILDIGMESAEKFAKIVHDSGTIIWNGPLGLYEFTPFQNGSRTVAKALAANKNATSIIGGGDTIDSIKRFNISPDQFTHVSTGGGACIEFLAGKSLPGIEIFKSS